MSVKVKGRAWIAAVGAALAVVAVAPASAAATTFGADLNQPANNPITCNDGWPAQIFPIFYNAGNSSCMWLSGGTAQSFYAPGGGTVTAVRVKVGEVTGQMQIVVVRSLYRNTTTPGKPEFACCVIQAYGPAFTPQANAVTTVPTNLPMQEDPTPAPTDTITIAAGDSLALEVLQAGVPVPATMTNGGQSDPAVPDFAWFPAPSQAGVSAPSSNVDVYQGDFSGFVVLMNADLSTGGGGGGAPAGGGGGGGAPVGGAGPAPPTPAFALPKLTIPVSGNTATVPVQCLRADCTGTLALQNAQLAGLARVAKNKAKKPKVVSYGTASFSLKAGTTGKFKIKLNAAGRALFKKGKKTAKVWANLRFSSGGGASKSVRVTLKH